MKKIDCVRCSLAVWLARYASKIMQEQGIDQNQWLKYEFEKL